VTAPGDDLLTEQELEALLRRLHLAHMRRVYMDVVRRAEEGSWPYRDFLALLVREEVAHRKQTRLQRFTRRARFPYLKTIDEFDFTLQSTLRASLIGSYLGPDFVTEGRSLILHGKTGRGKTHLAVAIAYRAIQNGFEALFTTAAQLIETLAVATQKGRLHDALATYTHPHVLVIDEVGYLSYGPDAANVLYHVVNDRHLRRRPMIFTTNKPLREWGRVLHDPDLAVAILDRVLERGRLVSLDGPSGRTRHLNLDEALPQTDERLRISGIAGSEFPEPTQKRSGANRSRGVGLREVCAQVRDGLLGVGVIHQGPEPPGDVLHRSAIVAQKVLQIVGILVLTALVEGEGLEHDERTRPTHRGIAGRLLTPQRASFQANTQAIPKREAQPGCDDRGEIRLQILQAATTQACASRRHQEVHGGSALHVPPPLPDHVASFRPVRLEAPATKPLPERVVTAGIEKPDRKSQVEVGRSDVRGAGRDVLDQEGRDEPPDDDHVVEQIPQRGTELKTRGVHELELRRSVALGCPRLRHACSRSRRSLRSSSAASRARSGWALRSR
jgi:DNA replication protein DnaC